MSFYVLIFDNLNDEFECPIGKVQSLIQHVAWIWKATMLNDIVVF
jgi:hypothetical protein